MYLRFLKNTILGYLLDVLCNFSLERFGYLG